MLILRPYQDEALTKIKKRLKEVSHPLLATVSVGGGKSILISKVLSWAASYGYRCLCLTLNSTLIKQNADTHKRENGDYGINCASMKSKASEDLIIFGSPNSICQQIRNKQEVCTKPFQLIIVDECHQISHNPNSMYQRIFSHYGAMAQKEQYNFRILGFSGTPFRDKNQSICGPEAFFKEEVCNITTQQLIAEGYLVKPYFGLTQSESFNFKDVKIGNTGKFNQKQLQEITDKSVRLTGKIMHELQQIECMGMFIFCSTISHCFEALRSLPQNKSAVIIGNTPHKERQKILAKAQRGEIKFLVSVSILMVGVDIPLYNYCAWLRPTESLILFIQGIGRVLRLHPDKDHATVLDFSGNIERFQDIDNPIINEAIKPKPQQEDQYIIPCYDCGQLNKILSRRCCGSINNKRCEHYFEFKPCHACETQNDTTARHCRSCQAELIDPNAKLKSQAATKDVNEFIVKKARYGVSSNMKDGTAILRCAYTTVEGKVIYEAHFTSTEKARNIFYGSFVRQCVTDASSYYPYLSDPHRMRAMLSSIKTPHRLVCYKEDDRWKIRKKVFYGGP